MNLLRPLATLTTAGLAAAALALPAAAADVDVGVSVQISQPGVYGRIDIGRFPNPQVIVAQPVIVQPAPVARPVQPMYLWVPPGHRKNWKKHCRDYGACGVPVYFVRHDWYDSHVKPPRAQHHGHAGKGPGHKDHRGGERKGRGKGD